MNKYITLIEKTLTLLKKLMTQEAIKLDLINWLTKLEDLETIEYLKVIKEAKTSDHDWWDDLSDEQKKGIERGFRDVENGRLVAHEDVMKKYGL